MPYLDFGQVLDHAGFPNGGQIIIIGRTPRVRSGPLLVCIIMDQAATLLGLLLVTPVVIITPLIIQMSASILDDGPDTIIT